MRRIMALDLSTSCSGYAVIFAPEHLPWTVERYGGLAADCAAKDLGKFPFCYVQAGLTMRDRVLELVAEVQEADRLDAIVIEATNSGRASASSQSAIEYLHCLLLLKLRSLFMPERVHYLATGVWRSRLGIRLSKEDQKNNRKARTANKAGGTVKERNRLKAEAGVTKVIDRKDVARRYVQGRYGIELRPGEHDAAEAIALGTAILEGARCLCCYA